MPRSRFRPSNPPIPPRRSAESDALRLLAPRALTAREVADRLTRRGHSKEAITAAMSAMIRSGYVDDRRLAYNVWGARSGRIPMGPARIEADLRRRGVSDEDIRAGREDWGEAIDGPRFLGEALAIHLERKGPPRDAKEHGRLARRLVRRGFPPSEVLKALRPYGAEGRGRVLESGIDDDDFD